MKRYIFKAAAACAMVMALAACQKEGALQSENGDITTTSPYVDGKVPVTVNVAEVVSRASEVVDLTPNFNTSIDLIKENGFYLYVAQSAENITLVKMLYRTEAGKKAGDEGVQDTDLKWIAYGIEDGMVTDDKKGQKTFYWVNQAVARVAAIYSPNKVLSQDDFIGGYICNLPTEYNSFEDFKKADILYATNADGASVTMVSDTAPNDQNPGMITINFKHLLSVVTIDPASRYKEDTQYVDNMNMYGVYTKFKFVLGAEGNEVSDYIRPLSTDGIASIKMFRYPERAEEVDDFSVASTSSDTVFICAFPPQNTELVSGGLEFKFPIVNLQGDSPVKSDYTFSLDDAIYNPNSHLYLNVDDQQFNQPS